MAVTPNYSWPVPVATDYVKDGWEAISDLGNAIDTTVAGLGGGLTLIDSQTVTGSSGISLTNVFSNSNKAYRIVCGFIASGTADLFIRFRENITDKSASYYGVNYGANNAGTYASFGNNNLAQFNLLNINSGQVVQRPLTIDVLRPSATTGQILGQYVMEDGYSQTFSGINRQMTNFTGITIYPSSGTFTGYLRLYKYQDS